MGTISEDRKKLEERIYKGYLNIEDGNIDLVRKARDYCKNNPDGDIKYNVIGDVHVISISSDSDDFLQYDLNELSIEDFKKLKLKNGMIISIYPAGNASFDSSVIIFPESFERYYSRYRRSITDRQKGLGFKVKPSEVENGNSIIDVALEFFKNCLADISTILDRNEITTKNERYYYEQYEEVVKLTENYIKILSEFKRNLGFEPSYTTFEDSEEVSKRL